MSQKTEFLKNHYSSLYGFAYVSKDVELVIIFTFTWCYALKLQICQIFISAWVYFVESLFKNFFLGLNKAVFNTLCWIIFYFILCEKHYRRKFFYLKEFFLNFWFTIIWSERKKHFKNRPSQKTIRNDLSLPNNVSNLKCIEVALLF